MFLSQGKPIRQSIPQPFPKDICLLGEIKSLVNGLINSMGIVKRFKPRLYSYADFVFVKLYAIAKGIPTERAADILNNKLIAYYRVNFDLNIKKFRDQTRTRRFIPHQTDVDKFFRLFSKNEVKQFFGNLLMALNREIFRRLDLSGSFRLLVDNTEYGYYGNPIPPYNVGTTRKQGTKNCHLFQGHALQGADLTLFTDFELLEKGKYRSLHIPSSVEWMRWCGIKLSYALMDREFYRASLIKDLKNRHLGVIIPAKKYPKVRKAISDYLLGRRPLVENYYFSQAPKTKPYPKSVHLSLVIVGKKDQSAAEIRRQFRLKKVTFDKALQSLSAFFTTLKVPRNVNRWARWLTRSYKKRWCEETGFSKLNEIHPSFRNRYPVIQLAQLYLRAIIYNNWQCYKKIAEHAKIKPSKRSLGCYLTYYQDRLEQICFMSVKQNIKYLQKSKRRVYFKV